MLPLFQSDSVVTDVIKKLPLWQSDSVDADVTRMLPPFMWHHFCEKRREKHYEEVSSLVIRLICQRKGIDNSRGALYTNVSSLVIRLICERKGIHVLGRAAAEDNQFWLQAFVQGKILWDQISWRHWWRRRRSSSRRSSMLIVSKLPAVSMSWKSIQYGSRKGINLRGKLRCFL